MTFAVRATHGSTVSSSEVAGDDIPTERTRLAPLRNALMLDSGAQVSAVPRQQIDEVHYNPGPSNVTGLKGISGEDIPRYGHVELNLRRGQDVVQVGAEVADIEHGIIATDAIVKRGRSVLHSPAGHWIVDGTLEPPSQTTAIKLKTHQANYYLEFEILKLYETDRSMSVAAVRRGYRARHPPEANQVTLPKTMGPESDEQMTLPTRTLKSPGQRSIEERTALEMHHLPSRPWCLECVEARGVDDPHRQPALDELATPKVMFDIFFVGPDELAKRYKIVNGCFSLRDKERFLSSQELDQTIAVLDLIDCKTNAQGTLFANKEVDEYTTVILQTDQEPATMSIANAVRDRRAKSTIVRGSSAYSKQSAGHVEGANRLAAGLLRTYKLKLEPRASFRRSPVSGQKFFTVLSLHISNIYAKKKGIAKKLIQTLRALMISQEVDLVAGDFNGTAWRCRSRDNHLSTVDDAFSDCALPTPPGPTPLWGPGSIPNNWADVYGFLEQPALA